MKKLVGLFVCACVAMVLSFGSTGCQKDTPKKTDVAVSADPAKLTMKSGEKRHVDLKFTRGKDASKEITLAVEVDPKDKGVTASLEPVKIAGDKSTDAKLTVETGEKPTAGDYTVTVTTKSADAATVTTKVAVKVEGVKVETPKTGDKDITGVDSTAKIKAGESETVDVKFKRGTKADHEITLTVAVDPKDKGVTATLDADKIAKDKSAGKVTIKSDNTAKGEYTVTVTGKSDGAKDAWSKVVVTIKEAVAGTPKKDMSLAVTGAPEKATTIKQGKDATITLKVALGTDLGASELKAEVTDAKDAAVKEADIKVAIEKAKLNKSGDAKVTITVGDAAAPGDYTVTISTTGEGALPASVSTKIAVKVEKK